MPVSGELGDFLQKLGFDFLALGRIGAEIEKEVAGFEAEELRRADKIGEAEFLADADEEARAEIGERLVQNRKRDLVGMRDGYGGVGEMHDGLFLGHDFFARG